MAFYLGTIAAQMAKKGDDVKFQDQQETEELMEMQQRGQREETQQDLLQTLGRGPL